MFGNVWKTSFWPLPGHFWHKKFQNDDSQKQNYVSSILSLHAALTK